MAIDNHINKQLHALLTQTGLMNMKEDLVMQYTDGKSKSSKDLHNVQAINLIHYLKDYLQKKQDGIGADVAKRNYNFNAQEYASTAQRMRKKLISLCYNVFWVTYDGKADIERLDNWVQKQFCKCPLNSCTVKQLGTLITIFEQKIVKPFLNDNK
jgi:hypothetical protein